MDKKTALLHAQTHSYKALVAKTRAFIADSLSKVEKPYLACSFGKDSAVMLHLVLQEKPGIDVIFVSRLETNLVDNYEDMITAWDLKNLRIVDFEGNTFDFISKSVIKSGMAKIEQEYDAFFVGLRAQESVGRRITLKKDGMFYLNKSGLVRICPVAFWTEREIATYCLANDLPTLSTYQVEGFSARTTAGISSKTPEVSLSSLKNRDIVAFNRLLELMPEAKYYV